jgi:chorismate dehydratase
VLDEIAIASLGEVKSVLLAHRVPLESVQTVHCDPASLTSVNLLKVLLGERGLQPEFVPLPDYAAAPGLEAVLLIGDEAIAFSRAGHPHQLWDLGGAWFEMTNLPFVYAVWVLQRGREMRELRRALREARDFGLDTLDSIIRNRDEFDLDFRKDYLGWHIHYHLGTDEKRGIRRFKALMEKHGLGPVHEPRYLH